MRKIVALLVAVAGLAVAASPASAAGFKGVVVAKDAGRSAVAVASANGAIHTFRSAKAPGLRVGQVVAASGSKLADGTYRAATLRVVGQARTTRLRATVIRNQKAQRRLLVSGGSTTFVLRSRAAARALASRGEDGPKPGDEITAKVDLSTGTPTTTTVTTVGHLGTLELEGIVTKLDAGSIELIVAKSGFVTIALPAGFTLPPGLAVFDAVSIKVAVSTTGALTLVSVENDENDDHGDRADDDDDDDSGDVDEDDGDDESDD
jgi:hypothetical protein